MQLDSLKLTMIAVFLLRCNHINRSNSLNKVTLILDHQVLSSEMCKVMVPPGHNNDTYYTLQSSSVFSLAKSLQLILGNSTTYGLFTNLLADYSAKAMSTSHSQVRTCLVDSLLQHNAFLFSLNQCIIIIIRFSFCYIHNDQGLSKCYQPQPLADNTYQDLDRSGHH